MKRVTTTNAPTDVTHSRFLATQASNAKERVTYDVRFMKCGNVNWALYAEKLELLVYDLTSIPPILSAIVAGGPRGRTSDTTFPDIQGQSSLLPRLWHLNMGI